MLLFHDLPPEQRKQKLDSHLKELKAQLAEAQSQNAVSKIGQLKTDLTKCRFEIKIASGWNLGALELFKKDIANGWVERAQNAVATRRARVASVRLYDTFIDETDRDASAIPNEDDLIEFILYMYYRLGVFTGREPFVEKWIALNFRYVIQHITQKYDGFSLTEGNKSILQGVFETIAQTSDLYKGISHPRIAWNVAALSHVLMTHLFHASVNGTWSWDIVIYSIMSLTLYAATGVRNGDVSLSSHYASDPSDPYKNFCLTYKDIVIWLVNDDPNIDNLQAKVLFRFTNGFRDSSNDDSSKFVYPCHSSPHLCFITNLLVHALRHGLVEGTSIDQVLNNALKRTDKKIVWLYPDYPVLCAKQTRVSSTYESLVLNNPATTGQSLLTLQSLCKEGNLNYKPVLHSLRREYAQQSGSLSSVEPDGIKRQREDRFMNGNTAKKRLLSLNAPGQSRLQQPLFKAAVETDTTSSLTSTSTSSSSYNTSALSTATSPPLCISVEQPLAAAGASKGSRSDLFDSSILVGEDEDETREFDEALDEALQWSSALAVFNKESTELTEADIGNLELALHLDNCLNYISKYCKINSVAKNEVAMSCGHNSFIADANILARHSVNGNSREPATAFIYSCSLCEFRTVNEEEHKLHVDDCVEPDKMIKRHSAAKERPSMSEPETKKSASTTQNVRAKLNCPACNEIFFNQNSFSSHVVHTHKAFFGCQCCAWCGENTRYKHLNYVKAHLKEFHAVSRERIATLELVYMVINDYVEERPAWIL